MYLFGLLIICGQYLCGQYLCRQQADNIGHVCVLCVCAAHVYAALTVCVCVCAAHVHAALIMYVDNRLDTRFRE